MRKILTLLMLLTFSVCSVSAENLNKTISTLNINKSAVSVSVIEVKNNDVIFSLNDRVPRLPASTLKLLTASASENALGKDYKYNTSLFKSTNNDLYLKLSADPLLTSADLEKLIVTAREKGIAPKTFYVDDSAFDSVEWGEGWQWDDDLNPLMPKFSVYNINRNLLKIDVSPAVNGAPAILKVKPFYPITFVNEIVTNLKEPNKFKIDNSDTIAPNMLRASGTISKKTSVTIPVLNPKINFMLRLEDSIRDKKLEYYSAFKNEKLPGENVYLVDTVEHELSAMIPLIIKNSNNFVAETVFKTAGAQWTEDQGKISNSLKMLDNYIETIGLNSEDIKVVDGSGVSKNNLMTSQFMAQFLQYRASKEDFEVFYSYLPAPGEGTLKNRMLYFKDNLRAKTGTLSDTSAIAGYITSRRGKLYAFDIMINDAKTSPSDKKNVEEQILRSIYLNY